jgi:palmitoyl-protein thioesterase
MMVRNLCCFLFLTTSSTVFAADGAASLSDFKRNVNAIIGINPLAATKSLVANGIGGQILNVLRSPKRQALFDGSSTGGVMPVVQMHGLGDFANNPHGMVPLAQSISDYLGGAYVINVQTGINSIDDISNSYFMSLNDQVDFFAAVVSSDPALAHGFNAIGYSQGSLVIRGYIEKYNNPPVLNFISMHGPLAGISDFGDGGGEFTGTETGTGTGTGNLSFQVTELLRSSAYTPEVQAGFAPSNYYRDPYLVDEYREHSSFLKNINNEIRNSEAVKTKLQLLNWASLKSLCLVQAEKDTEIIPAQSSSFGFYEDGARNYILEFNETPWYEGDYFGLQTLDNAGKVHFHTTNAAHLEFNVNTVLDLVKLYFL